MTQRDLAEAAGLSNAYISMVERGADAPPGAKGVIRSPSLDVLEKLAPVLRVRVEWLAFESGAMNAAATCDHGIEVEEDGSGCPECDSTVDGNSNGEDAA